MTGGVWTQLWGRLAAGGGQEKLPEGDQKAGEEGGEDQERGHQEGRRGQGGEGDEGASISSVMIMVKEMSTCEHRWTPGVSW